MVLHLRWLVMSVSSRCIYCDNLFFADYRLDNAVDSVRTFDSVKSVNSIGYIRYWKTTELC